MKKREKIIILIIILLGLIIITFFISDIFSRYTISANILKIGITRNSCYDSDSGINPKIQGNVSGLYSKKGYLYYDYCINQEILKEYYCSKTIKKEINVSCKSKGYDLCSLRKCANNPPLMPEGNRTLNVTAISYVDAAFLNQEIFELTLYPGWNLISIPLEPENPSREVIFPSSIFSSIWEYAQTGYISPNIIVSKKGYWVYANQNTIISISGIRLEDKTVQVNPGWNLIGVIENENFPQEDFVSAVWEYNNPSGYQVPSQLLEGKGFWIKASQSGILFTQEPGRIPTPKCGNLDEEIQNSWNFFKSYFIQGTHSEAEGKYTVNGGVHRGNIDNWDMVSEGQGYGLLISLYMNEQETFDNILNFLYTKMYNSDGVFDWHADKNGNIIAYNGATDAEEDIALSLIFTDKLVEEGKWQDTGKNYRQKAQNLLNAIWEQEVEHPTNVLKPGNKWGGSSITNPSYFSPAYYRIFNQFDTNSLHNWLGVVDKSYEIIGKSPGYFNGLIPDWCDVNCLEVLGYSYDMTYDAIRVPFRLSLDNIWFQDVRAFNYENNVMNFVDASSCKMYKLIGQEIEYHSELTTSMFGSGSAGASIFTGGIWEIHPECPEFVNELKNFYNQEGYFGSWTGAKDYYYNQALSIIGSLVMNGNFTNLA